MHRTAARFFFLTALLAILSLSNAGATGKIAIDVLHGGQPDADTWMTDPDLSSLYPDFHFVPFHASRLPIYQILAEGTFTSQSDDSVVVTVPENAACLYVVVSRTLHYEQYPIPIIIDPQQRSYEGAYGVGHVDDPVPGQYVVYVGYTYSGQRYEIGIGPHIWEVYPPEDYDAIVEFQCTTWYLFTGRGIPRSESDFTCLQQYLNAGGGIGLFYDGADPIALKPIIRLHDFARQGASIRIDLPGHLTYSVPPPKSTQPLTWEISPTSSDIELDYEAEFRQPLNFVTHDGESGQYVNRSWATVHDAKILRFVSGAGYRISELGTLAPGKDTAIRSSELLPFSAARTGLDQLLRCEAIEAGLSRDETETFFDKYQWAMRLLQESCDARGEIVLYRLEDSDYDALFALSSDPAPIELRRMLWVFSILPDDVTEVYPVHPPVPASVHAPASHTAGVYHEYGFFRETYGGDALDEMDAWGWHFYDDPLQDPTDHGEEETDVYFHTWGINPLVAELSQGVTQVEGCYSGGISPQAGAVEVVLSGDADTYAEGFPAGSFPPVIVAREETAGGRIVGYGDLTFIADLSDNRQLTQNVFDWLCVGATGEGPDIDIADAVVETTLAENMTGNTTLQVYNLGNEPLEITTQFPSVGWISITGPANATVDPDDSLAYALEWSSGDLQPGYYTADWTFDSNDPNEANLVWPVRLHVSGTSAVDPHHDGQLPAQFELLPAYPNPFNAQTNISFRLPVSAEVVFDMYNLIGQHVAQVATGKWTAGSHIIRLDFSQRPAGLYFLRAKTGADVRVQKLMLLK